MISTGYITSFDSSDIHYMKVGKGKQKVILCHGIMGDRKLWMTYVAGLLRDFQFIIPDIRGHGQSRNKSPFSENPVNDVAIDIHHIIEKELNSDEKIIFVGFSMGCLFNLAYVKRFGTSKIKSIMHIDHALEFSSHPDIDNRVFRGDHGEYRLLYRSLIEKIAHDPDRYLRSHLSTVPNHIQTMVYRLFEIIFDTALTGVKGRLGRTIYEHLPSTTFARTYVELKSRWAGYVLFASVYDHDTNDYCQIASTVDVPIVFYVGMKNDVFNPQYQIELIKQHCPRGRIIKFSESGHDLMLNEYGTFMWAFDTELRTMISSA